MIDDLDAAAAAYADAIRAATDLVDRTGARELDLGYLDGALPGQTYWFAHAEHAGARVSVENHHGPREALEALARQLLTGTRCPHCGRPVTLTDEDAATADDRRCHYRRVGPRWVRGCEPARRPSAKRRHRAITATGAAATDRVARPLSGPLAAARAPRRVWVSPTLRRGAHRAAELVGPDLDHLVPPDPRWYQLVHVDRSQLVHADRSRVMLVGDDVARRGHRPGGRTPAGCGPPSPPARPSTARRRPCAAIGAALSTTAEAARRRFGGVHSR